MDGTKWLTFRESSEVENKKEERCEFAGILNQEKGRFEAVAGMNFVNDFVGF